MWQFEVRTHPADASRGAEAEGRGDADQDVTQGDGALDTSADVEQSVIGGGNDSRLHSGYEAESGEDCNVNYPVGVHPSCVAERRHNWSRVSTRWQYGRRTNGAAVPSNTEETGDSAGLPGDEATMAEPDTSSIMGKRSEQLAGRKRYPQRWKRPPDYYF